jgi:hypothetical protein
MIKKCSNGEIATLRANPAKVEDFGGKDLLQDIGWRILFSEVISLRRDAR